MAATFELKRTSEHFMTTTSLWQKSAGPKLGRSCSLGGHSRMV